VKSTNRETSISREIWSTFSSPVQIKVDVQVKVESLPNSNGQKQNPIVYEDGAKSAGQNGGKW